MATGCRIMTPYKGIAKVQQGTDHPTSSPAFVIKLVWQQDFLHQRLPEVSYIPNRSEWSETYQGKVLTLISVTVFSNHQKTSNCQSVMGAENWRVFHDPQKLLLFKSQVLNLQFSTNLRPTKTNYSTSLYVRLWHELCVKTSTSPTDTRSLDSTSSFARQAGMELSGSTYATLSSIIMSDPSVVRP